MLGDSFWMCIATFGDLGVLIVKGLGSQEESFNMDADHGESGIQEAWQSRTVVKLKDVLRAHGLSSTGNKAELILRICEADPQGEWRHHGANDE